MTTDAESNQTPTDKVKTFLLESDFYHSVSMIAVATGLAPGQVNQIVYDLKGMGLVLMKTTKRGIPTFAWFDMWGVKANEQDDQSR